MAISSRYSSLIRTCIGYSSSPSRNFAASVPKSAVRNVDPICPMLNPSRNAFSLEICTYNSGLYFSRSERNPSMPGICNTFSKVSIRRRSNARSVWKSSPRISIVMGFPTGGPKRCFSTLISTPGICGIASCNCFHNAKVEIPCRSWYSLKATVIFPLCGVTLRSGRIGSPAPIPTFASTVCTAGLSLPSTSYTRCSIIRVKESVTAASVPTGVLT